MKMIELVEQLPAQLAEALEIGAAATLNKHTSPIRNVFVAGMGGSGIGAEFVKEFTREELKVPFVVCKGYQIPKFVNKFTLAIISSYSGNTEETLSCFDELLKTGAKIIVVASGGKAIAKAKELGLDHVIVPAGSPSPRACIGYSIGTQAYVLTQMGVISSRTVKQLEGAVALMRKEQDNLRKAGEKLANQIYGKIPAIYTTDRMESVAVRFRQQVNENSKSLAWHHVIPEMNHNELVGWRGDYSNIVAVYFRHKDDFNRNSVRMDINQQTIAETQASIINLYSKGKNLVEKALYFVLLGDFATCFLCDLRGYDSIEVNAINHLKGELAKI
jgi:glucose/mannose-6-phosphate isomerase